jgi:hypothetical protein
MGETVKSVIQFKNKTQIRLTYRIMSFLIYELNSGTQNVHCIVPN